MAPASLMMRGNDPAASKFRSAQFQQSSTLMRLPIEVRDQIYWMLLGGCLLHIDFESEEDGSRMCHCICQQLSKEEYRQQLSLYLDPDSSYLYGSERPHNHIKCRPGNNKPETQWLDLRALRTCQQMYYEAIPTLWTTNTFSFDDRSAFREYFWDKTVEQRQMIRHVRFDVSDLTTLDWWLRDAQSLLVDVTKENTLHLTVSVKKGHARHWPHPGACKLAHHVLGADPYLFLCTAQFNIEVENNYGGVSVITAEEIKRCIRQTR